MLSRVHTVVERESIVVHDQLDRNDIEVIHGTASFVGPNQIAVEGTDGTRRVSARFVLVCTGSRAIMPGGTETDPECVFTSDTILQAPRLPRTLLVIGAGVIGIEYGAGDHHGQGGAAARIHRPRDRGRAGAPDAQGAGHLPPWRGSGGCGQGIHRRGSRARDRDHQERQEDDDRDGAGERGPHRQHRVVEPGRGWTAG
ncbi:MAG: hypothetical protein EBR71_12085 [Planctomycetes bacterium]|nr:hypothetical protein [Planctomycetota bacterium]